MRNEETIINIDDFILPLDEVSQKCAEISKERGLKKLLDVGGRRLRENVAKYHNYDYYWSNIEYPSKWGKGEDGRFFLDDICKSKISDNSFDIVYSYDVFEHLLEPWKAAEHCVRICKPGGLLFHSTLFMWRLHASPIDCYRYTHMGLSHLFERTGKVKTICSGYEQHGKNSWRVYYLGEKKIIEEIVLYV